MVICKNCGANVTGSYCSHCGQHASPERISLRYIWDEVFHFFTHIQHGFLFTTWQMLREPGPMVVSYIDGKRKSYQSPISYFLIWVAAFIFTLYILVQLFGENAVIDYHNYFGPGASTAFAISNLSIMLAFIVPIQAIYLYLLITRRRYNYMESGAIMIYAVGTIIFLQLVFAIIALLQFLVTKTALPLQYSDVLKAGYFIWFSISIVNTLQLRQRGLRAIVFLLLATGTFTVWRLYVVPSVTALLMH